ncbi:DUF1501 domain-containing protein [Luteolibacter ambystomatis]|uniref:DUF1501 domain-containing protein n=1 Tax=Luteolibacter ambystomatis TaxID=2824561 RepID=A0A975IYZ3_9BACT|nr:DUF1501 domain-containing protein [Luteolibacter ambystomatis]QUE50926.1 DUF1501 domain-containing protein [Luteolibacter ambystomatis]
MADPFFITRRHFFSRMSAGLGGLALGSLLGNRALGENVSPLLPGYAPKAKRVIYLFMSGGPAQHDLWDDKPLLRERNGEGLPDSVRGNQRLTGMSGSQAILPLAGSHFKFKPMGKNGTMVSELLPHTGAMIDDICLVKSMFTEAINHDPAMTFFQTGSQIAGRPSMGSWIHYGLGSMNENLPAFVVLVTKKMTDQPLYARLWGSGFLDSRYQGVRFSPGQDAVFYLTNPDGICGSGRRALLDKLGDLNRASFEKELDPEIESRIAQYEMAYRMQTSVPEATTIANESQSVLDLYGPDVAQAGSFAANCLQARRLAERGVRFIQLYHPGWDSHANLPRQLPGLAKEIDQPCAGLLRDLKQRGMLEDTLVVWGGEFGRTAYSQGVLTASNYGRDHHPRCFSLWMAGGGIKPGIIHGATDDFGYNITENPVHVHDLHATILNQLGLDHTKLTFFHQGRHFRLTDVAGKVVKDILV